MRGLGRSTKTERGEKHADHVNNPESGSANGEGSPPDDRRK